MEDKDWIGMDCCPLCGEPKSIIMDRRMKKTLDKYMCISPELCTNCVEKLKEENAFIMYEADPQKNSKGVLVDNLTGRYIKMNFEAISKDYPGYKFIEKNRFILADLENFGHFYKQIKENKEKTDETLCKS